MNIKMFKFYMLTTCVSYTFVILLQTLLFHFNHQNMSNELVVMIFIVCVIVNLLINVTHYLELQEGKPISLFNYRNSFL